MEVAMSQNRESQLTEHGMLVAWGQYAHGLGLIQAIEAIPLEQKTVEHSPQGKVLEFLVTMLGGFEYLKDISLSAHPLDKDETVARAWGQAGWADHSGVSRTLTGLSEAEVEQIVGVLERVSQPLLDQEVVLALRQGPLELDGDLSPRPVSNTSATYPEASYGHMNNELRLGYQAAVVTMSSPTYGRLGLSVVQHSGKTLSLSQAEALALEAERRLGRRPLRRTDLLEQRLGQLLPEGSKLAQQLLQARQKLAQVEAERATVVDQLQQARQAFEQQQAEYARRQRPERPTSHLAKARQQVEVYQRRLERRQRAVGKAQEWLTRQEARLAEWETALHSLEERLKCFHTDNAANPVPIQAIFRLDAGFGTADNLALLIELGYEVYTKPYGPWLSGLLATQSPATNDWKKVGRNAEMMAWPAVVVPDFPYPLDLAYERFWTGHEYRFSGLVHFGPRPVTTDLPGWFEYYNARQIIEAGHKEGKQVFEVHHLKVRARPALPLQEHFGLFGANFVRFATHWLAQQCPQFPATWQNRASPRLKEQVKVGAHSPARVEWLGQDCLLRFEDRSVYASRSLRIKRQVAIQLTLPMKFVDFLPI
jgi:hypothetical protein